MENTWCRARPPRVTDTLDTPWSAEPDRRNGATGPAYQQLHPPAPSTHTPTPILGLPAWPLWLCHPRGEGLLSAQDLGSRRAATSGPSPHGPRTPCPTTKEQVARQAQMPTVVSRCWCGPEGTQGRGHRARGSEWGRAQRSPACWAAVGPSSSHGHRQAPGPARGCQSPANAHSHLVLQTGSFRTHGASWQGDVPISPSAHVASGPCPSVREEGQSWLTGSGLGDTMQDCAVLQGRVPRHVTAST